MNLTQMVTLDDDTLRRVQGSGGNVFRFWTQSLAPLPPISGPFAAAFVLLHGANLAAVATVHAGSPAAHVIGAALERILAFLPRRVPELRFASERARALAVVYPAAVLSLVQFAGMGDVGESSDSEDAKCTKNNPSLRHLSAMLELSVWQRFLFQRNTYNKTKYFVSSKHLFRYLI